MLADVIGSILLGAGLLVATVGLIGLLRMDAVMPQLHASGLVTGPAVILVLAASVATGEAETITSAVLVILFVLITSPLAAHAIGQVAYRNREGEGDETGPEPEGKVNSGP